MAQNWQLKHLFNKMRTVCSILVALYFQNFHSLQGSLVDNVFEKFYFKEKKLIK